VAEERFEVLERCIACDCPVRVRRLSPEGLPQIGSEETLVKEHVTYHATTFCVDCLQQLPVLLGMATRLGFPGLQEFSFN